MEHSAGSELQAPRHARLERPGQLGAVEAHFIQSWGAAASSFGVDPVLGRVHALAFLAHEPLRARQIAATLGLAEDRVEACLRGLERWGAVHEVDGEQGLFEANGDPWSWFLHTLRDRGRREFAPLLHSFREANAQAQRLRAELHPEAHGERRSIERMARFCEFVDQLAGVLETFANLGAGPMLGAMRMLAKVRGPRLARS